MTTSPAPHHLFAQELTGKRSQPHDVRDGFRIPAFREHPDRDHFLNLGARLILLANRVHHLSEQFRLLLFGQRLDGAFVILVLTLLNVVRLLLFKGRRAARLGASIDAILFWGGLTAVFGFLGQWVGLYRGANAIFDAPAVNPELVVLGFGESLGTSVFGMFVLVVAAFLWFALRAMRGWRMVR